MSADQMAKGLQTAVSALTGGIAIAVLSDGSLSLVGAGIVIMGSAVLVNGVAVD